MLDSAFISQLCSRHLSAPPETIERCAVGIGNYVYIVTCGPQKYTVRCSKEENAYTETVFLLEKLHSADVPVPRIIARGHSEGFDYIILTYIPGSDLGLVYAQLTDSDKQAIARQVVSIQRRVALMDIRPQENSWKWQDVISETLDRAEHLIKQNGYFDPAKVEQLRAQGKLLDEYFASVEPVPYLDDISTKNLLIDNGRVSGIIDVDWMGFGDSLTYIALTCVALMNMDCDTDYIRHLLEETQPSPIQQLAFIFYCLMFCVDFMGERGTTFNDKTVEVNPAIVRRLNNIYEQLQRRWEEETLAL